MEGWILYINKCPNLASESYEVNRLLEESKNQGITLKVINPEQIDLVVTREDQKSLMVDGDFISLPNFVLPRMGAYTTYFALAVIRHLERLGVPCINSSLSIETVKDKLYTHQILAENNLPVPKTMLLKFPTNSEIIEKNLGFPVVVKTLSGSLGKGVFLAEDKSKFDDIMHLVEATNPNANIISQELIKDSYGRDLRVLVIGGRVIACMERRAAENGFKANYSLGGKVSAFKVTPEIEWLAIEASRILGLDIAGVDLLFDGEHFRVCEVNSSAGFKGIESCCDLNISSEILHYIKTRFGMF